MLVFVGANPVHRPPHHVAAGQDEHAQPRDRRHRSRARPRRRRPRRTTWRIKPKCDLTLLYALANILIAQRLDRPRLHRRAHRAASRSSRRTWPPSRLERAERGDRPAVPRRSLDLAAPHPRGQARSPSGGPWASTRATRACARPRRIINLALMTGNIGRPGTGANSITGQCNAMGSRLFSNTTSLLGGHDFLNAEPPAQGRRHPRHRPGRRSRTQNSLPTTRSSRGSTRGRSRACGSSPPTPRTPGSTRASCRTCSAGSTSWSCRTCTRPPRPRSCADLVLPAAGWGEKDGTFINSERRIGIVQKVLDAARRRRCRLRDLPPRRRRLGLRRDVPRVDLPRGGLPDPEAPVSGPALRHHRHPRLLHAAGEGRHPVALPGGSGSAGGDRRPAAVRGRPLLHRRRQGPAALRGHRAPARSPGRRIPADPAHGSRTRLPSGTPRPAPTR